MNSIFSQHPAAKKLVSPIRFPKEASLIEFGIKPNGKQRSTLFFTTQKCASTYVPKAFRVSNATTKARTSRLYNLAGYLLHTRNEDVYAYMRRRSVDLFHPSGAIYAPLRQMIDVEHIDRYNIILMLRDPRDVMVSNFYSLRHSHPLPGSRTHREEMVARRNLAMRQDVDTYVIENKDRFIGRFREFYEKLMWRPNVTFLTYEEMVVDFFSWAEKFLLAQDIRPTEERIAALRDARGIDPTVKDVTAHRRNGIPGEAQSGLRADTLRVLNRHFADVLEAYGAWGADGGLRA